MKLLVTGIPGAGKSTLIRALTEASGREPYGFYTRKGAPMPDGRVPVYIFPARGEGERSMVGAVSERGAERFPEAFDAAAEAYLRAVPEGSLVVMDELGIMESGAERFKSAVLRVLSGPYDVIAAVKPKRTEFLDAVRAVPGTEIYEVTAENRSALAEKLTAAVKSGG